MSRFAIFPAAAVTDTRLSPRDLTVLAAISVHTDRDGWCFPSMGRLGEMLGVTRQAVQKSIRALISAGYVQVQARNRENGSQTTNQIRVLFDSSNAEAQRAPPATSEVAPPATSEVAPPATSEVAPPATSEVAPIRNPSNDPIERETPPVAPKGGGAGRRKRDKVTFTAFLAACSDAGEKPIRRDDPIFAFARDIQLPRDFLLLAWRAFARKHADSGRLQKDWRAHFRDSVRGNWAKLWWCPEGRACELTTAGIQLQRELEAEKARELEQGA